MRRNVILAAALAIAVALAGCSKGEDGTIDNSMELDGQKIKKMIDEHLAGTWQCEGLFDIEPVLDDDMFVTSVKEGSYKYDSLDKTIVFRNDGTCTLIVPNKESDEQRIFEGTYEFDPETFYFHFNFQDNDAVKYLKHTYYGLFFERDYQTIYISSNLGYDKYKRI